jgi:hypothetical protein
MRYLMVCFFFIASLLIKADISLHEFYVSVCHINHNAADKTLELTFKLFTDDFERVLESIVEERLYLGNENEHAHTDNYVAEYLQQHFTLVVNGDSVQGEYLGKEVEVHNTWCYVEVTGIERVDSLVVHNSLLIDVFEEQSNIVHAKVGKLKKSLSLHKYQTLDTLRFN